MCPPPTPSDRKSLKQALESGEFAFKGHFEQTMGVLGKRLDQWAATKLTYVFPPELKGFGILEGSTRIAQWNPIHIILQYQYATKVVWEIERDEISLSLEDTKKLLGENPEVTEVKQMLLQLNMNGLRCADIAEKLGVSKQAVSHWRTGLKNASEEHVEKLRKLCGEKAPWGEHSKLVNHPVNTLVDSRLTVNQIPPPPGREINQKEESLATGDEHPPSKGLCKEIVLKHVTFDDESIVKKANPPCAKCPLRDRSFVPGWGGGGRGGVNFSDDCTER